MDDMELNWHKKMAIDTFNAVWELMDKRTGLMRRLSGCFTLHTLRYSTGALQVEQ